MPLVVEQPPTCMFPLAAIPIEAAHHPSLLQYATSIPLQSCDHFPVTCVETRDCGEIRQWFEHFLLSIPSARPVNESNVHYICIYNAALYCTGGHRLCTRFGLWTSSSTSMGMTEQHGKTTAACAYGASCRFHATVSQ